MRREDIYTLITNRIIDRLKQGIIPWKKGYSSIAPCNFLSKRPYAGINYWITNSNDFTSPFYLTYNQTKELGGSIISGQKGTPIVHWQILDKEIKLVNGETERKKIPLLKYYTVFNAEQIQGIKFPESKRQIFQVDVLDGIVENLNERPTVIHKSNQQPCYIPVRDEIRMPLKESFYSKEQYYQTLFHEIGHWTGAAKRLNREGIVNFDKFGSHQYSQEELVAEMVSAYAMNQAGLDAATFDNSAAYIKSWLKVLQNDNRFVFMAAKYAEQAWKFLNNEIQITQKAKEAA